MSAVAGQPRPGLREEILTLLEQGNTLRKTAEILQCSTSTVQYHSMRKHLAGKRWTPIEESYNWQEVQEFYNNGATAAQCQSQYGFSQTTWYKAIKRGLIKQKQTLSPFGVRTPEERARRALLRQERAAKKASAEPTKAPKVAPVVTKKQNKKAWVNSLPSGPLGSWGKKV